MESFHQQLLDPAIYPDRTRHVEFVETHISRVYLTDDHAYKFKKPLNLQFLDFSTLDRRRHFCEEEVRLNRRFCPDTYLGVVALRQSGDQVFFDGETGEDVDYAVQMRRLPEDRMLNRMLDDNDPELPDRMQDLARALHTAMQNAEICRHESPCNADTVKGNCTENFLQTEAAIGTSLTREAHRLMHKATVADLERLRETMMERENEGYVRDGHGDLHAANICMTTPIRIYDCIEFNRRFRVADIAADLAFLIMDLEFRGRRDLAAGLMSHYQALENDRQLETLLPFYKRYRAWVRGKVDAILADEPDASATTREEAATLARRYFNLALGYLLPPTLFIMTGLMGVGKTAVSRALSQATGASHLRSDVIRKERAGRAGNQPHDDAFGQGLYSRDKTAAVYDDLMLRTIETLQDGCSVIADASFMLQKQRDRFQAVAARLNVPVRLVSLHCPDKLAMARLDQRSNDASDGRRELYRDQKAVYEPIGSDPNLVTLDTTYPVDYNVQILLCRALTAGSKAHEK